MKTVEHNAKMIKVVRQFTVAAVIAGTALFPGEGSAGILDKAKAAVQQASGRVTELKNNVQAKVEGIQDKVEELDGEGLEQVMETVGSMLQFVKHAQAGYKSFVGTEKCAASSPCGVFRAQLRNMIVSFVTLPQDLPFVETVPPAAKQLEEMARLVDHMPPPMLYAAEKVLGNMFDEVQYRLEVLQYAASKLPTMPSMSDLAQATADSSLATSKSPATKSNANTRSSTSKKDYPFCSKVLADGKPHIDLVQVSLKAVHETISDVSGMMQNEQTFGITVLGGGTISVKNPPKGALDAIVLVLKLYERKLGLKVAVINSVCAMAGYTPTSD